MFIHFHYNCAVKMQGLNKDSRSMCNWDKQLNATQEVCVVR